MFRRNKKKEPSSSSLRSPAKGRGGGGGGKKGAKGGGGASAGLDTKNPIPLASQETCAKYLKQRMDHLGLEESHNYYQGLSTFVLNNRFIHLDVNISTKQLIVSTSIHEVVSGAAAAERNKGWLERSESFNQTKSLNSGSSLGWHDTDNQVMLTRKVAIGTLQSDAAFETVIAEFVQAAQEADKIFVGHKKAGADTRHRRVRQDSGYPNALRESPAAAAATTATATKVPPAKSP